MEQTSRDGVREPQAAALGDAAKAATAGASAAGSASPEASAEVFRAYAERLIAFGCEMGRLRASDRINKGMRGLPAIMRTLSMAGEPLSPSEIAHRTGVSDARVANALRALEERGLVSRSTSLSDRRRVEVSLTEEGAAQHERLRENGISMVADFLEELGEQDSREFVRIVGRIESLMAARYEQGRQVRPPADPFSLSQGHEATGEGDRA